MRVAFLTNFIPPYRVSFYEKLCRHPVHRTVVLHGLAQSDSGRPHHEGGIDAPTAPVHNTERRLGPFTVRWQAGALTQVRQSQPDLVVLLGMVGSVSTWLVLLWARATGRKVVVWACGWEPQSPGSLAWRAKQWLTRGFFSLSHRTLVYSSKGKANLAQAGVDPRRLIVCYNGIEVDQALAQEPLVQAQATTLRAQHAPGHGLVYLYVGGLLAEKRVDLLLGAFEQVVATNPGARLWMVGDGPERLALQALAEARFRPDQVLWFGRIVDGVDAYFAAADVFVLPGLGGLAFNQAMLWRTPCIGGQADGTEDDLVIDGVTGFRFEHGQLASLVSAMHRAAACQDLEAMGGAARRVILERSNVTAMVAIFHSTFDRLGDAP